MQQAAAAAKTCGEGRAAKLRLPPMMPNLGPHDQYLFAFVAARTTMAMLLLPG
ncbi:MAG: hypothetical protein IPK78_09995 [Rhodospirillales bacterium]|nr:hypothetical protein [Rhodospirillales bacterium]